MDINFLFMMFDNTLMKSFSSHIVMVLSYYTNLWECKLW